MKLIEAFDLPSPEELTALAFVVKLEAQGSAEKQRKLIEEYVLTPKVRDELPGLFEGLRHRLERGEDQGRFIHGSFGSGKSHFLSMLGLLLEGNEVAWEKSDPTIRKLALEHRDWIRRGNLLVVRVHMLSGGQGVGLDRALFEAFNQSLKLRGKEPFHFLNVDGVLDEARREAEQYGAAFWKQLSDANIVGGREDFEELARGSPRDREDLALSWLSFKKREVASAGLNPNWAEGLHKLSAHAKAQGFGGVVFLVDEFLLWLSEKNKEGFKTAINQLNVMIDHNTGQRAVPLFVFVARQRKLKEFFPEMVGEEALEEHLDHHSQRFETTELADVELRHICRNRVLKRRHEKEIEAVVEQVVEANQKLLAALLQRADPDYLRDVYPFHPALIETLIDVSALMQRERTALRLLYELLVIHNKDLELGKFIPVGRAFDALFPESGFEASTRGREQLQRVHKAWYQRFKPSLDALRQGEGSAEGGQRAIPEERLRTLEALVKTVLLAQISNRLRGPTGITVERLVRLNDVEVKGITDTGRMQKAFGDLRALAQKLPALQLSNPEDPRLCVVSVELEGASLADVLDLARGRVSNKNALLETYFRHLRQVLKLESRRGFIAEGRARCTFQLQWRGTARKVSLDFGNIRELSDSAFRPEEGEEVRLLVDYPWDEAGFTIEKDRERAKAVRRSYGSLPTVCWLPRHFTEAEARVLLDLAATEALLTPEHQVTLLSNLSQSDQKRLIEQAASHERVLRAALDEKLLSVYRDSGEIESLQGSSASLKIQQTELPAYVDALATAVLDARFNRHPELGMEPKAADLNLLCEWMTRANDTTDSWLPFGDDEARPLKQLGEPLELVQVGKEKAQLRRDGRFLKLVLDDCRGDSAPWNPIDDKLGGAEYGLQPLVRNLLLTFVARAYSFRIVDPNGETIEPQIEKRPIRNLTLRKAQLLKLAEWNRVRSLARELFGVDNVATHLTLREHDRLASALRTGAQARHDSLKVLHERISKLGAVGTKRLEELREALARLARVLKERPEPSATLQEVLSLFPDQTDDLAPAVIRTADEVLKAVQAIETNSVTLLASSVGVEPRQTLAKLQNALGDGTLEWKLTPGFIKEWNLEATEVVKRALAQRILPRTEGDGDKPGGGGEIIISPPEPTERAFEVRGRRVNAGDRRAVDALLGEVRTKLEELGGEIEIELVARRKR